MIAIANSQIHEFVLLLREKGARIGLSEHLDAQYCYRAFSSSTTRKYSPLFLALRSVLAKKLDDYEIFERAYEEFFLSKYLGRGPNVVPSFARKDKPTSVQDRRLSGNQEQRRSDDDPRKAILALYSKNRSTQQTVDFRGVEPFDPNEIKFLARTLRKLGRMNKALPGRRKSFYSGDRSNHRNWRKFAREMSSRPYTMPQLQFMKKKLAKSKFVIMADVSGSMLKETELIINSLFTASRRFHGTEAFVFSTGLSRLTHFFSVASPNYETVQRFYSKQTEIELGSGTRIGENLARVITDFPNVISYDTALIIISDGWDLGDSDLLESCLKEVKHRGAKVVWFHPHFDHVDFSPETLAMKTAIPYIDLMIGPNGAVKSANR